jgi:hypothetical protein
MRSRLEAGPRCGSVQTRQRDFAMTEAVGPAVERGTWSQSASRFPRVGWRLPTWVAAAGMISTRQALSSLATSADRRPGCFWPSFSVLNRRLQRCVEASNPVERRSGLGRLKRPKSSHSFLTGLDAAEPSEQGQHVKQNWRADPLVWGHGPRVLEMFLEPTCPFSVKAFGKLDALLMEAGEDRITVKVRLQSQPWHMYSGVIVRCILAASTLENGRDAAKAVMAAVAAHRKEFDSTGTVAVQTLTPPQTTSSLESSAIAASKFLGLSGFRISTVRSSGTASMPARTASMCRQHS